ncbi:MAG: glucosyl-3-phosphoglycerate synthase [Tetrasphaera sp.]
MGQAAVSVLRHEEFPAAKLLEAKGEQRVSVVIPARDEEASVGAVVARVIADWVEAVALVDEVVVIDSDSVDATSRQAREAGATVYAAGQIRPDLGLAQGKGEALWKAMHVVRGDVLVFIDADLVEWGGHFVSGLLGPLLTDTDIQLVKAVYDRPMLAADGHEEEQGGRVTELVARPLIALHWPQLRGIVQPLSGEWAIRRRVLAELPMPTGYGVEIAALIDVAERFGSGAIAQVDLGRRAHRHHRHDTLGPMAVQVLAAAEARLGQHSAARPAEVVELVQYGPGTEDFAPRPRRVDIGERPPAASVPGYRGPAAGRVPT